MKPPSSIPDTDCGCITHTGPHFLHMDAFNFDRNLEYLKEGSVQLFLREEVRRLKELGRNLKLYNVDVIPKEWGFQGEGTRNKIAKDIVQQLIEKQQERKALWDELQKSQLRLNSGPLG